MLKSIVGLYTEPTVEVVIIFMQTCIKLGRKSKSKNILRSPIFAPFLLYMVKSRLEVHAVGLHNVSDHLHMSISFCHLLEILTRAGALDIPSLQCTKTFPPCIRHLRLSFSRLKHLFRRDSDAMKYTQIQDCNHFTQEVWFEKIHHRLKCH